MTTTIIDQGNNELDAMHKQKCLHCGRKFVRSRAYKEHTILCRELHKSKYLKETDLHDNISESDVPNPKEMYILLQKMMLKFEQQQKQIECLKRKLKVQEKKLDVIDWLNKSFNNENGTIEPIDCIRLITSYQVSEKEMNTLYNDSSGNKTGLSLQNALLKIVRSIFQHYEKSELSIQCFDNKMNILYILSQQPCKKENKRSWKQMTSNDIDEHIRMLHNTILFAFTKWRKEHKDEIESDNVFHDSLFVPRLNKIMNLKITHKQFKTMMFDILHQDASKIISYCV